MNLSRTIGFVVLFTVCCLSSLSQDSSSFKNHLTSYWSDTRSMIASPFQWNDKDIEKAVVFTGSTLFLMVNDERMNAFILRNRNEMTSDFLRSGVEPFGNGLLTLPLLGGLYLGGVLSDHPYDKRMALTGLKSFVLAAGGATIIKAALGRHRPEEDMPLDAFAFDGPFKGLDDQGSFLSRHSMVAFAVATTLAEGYRKDKKWVPWVAYSIASLVALSRPYNNEHWVSDAFAGACLGYITGKIVFKLNRNFVQGSP